MTHKLHAKTLLLVVLVSVLTLTLAAAIFFSVDWQNKTTAVAATVFEENTATYHFVNDTSYTDGYNTLWSYSRSSNYWQNSGETAQKKIETTLTLDILTSGNVAFKWLIKSWREPTYEYYTEAYFKVIKITGDQQETAYEKKPVAAENKKYGDTITIPVTEGDKLKFVVKGNYSSNSGYFQIMGLNVPTETFDVVAQVASDSIGNGTIKTDKEDDVFADNKITAVRGYNETLVFTAVPAEGYVAYWTRSDSYIKAGDEYKIYVSETSEGDPFVVHFVKSDNEDIIISYDKPQDSEMGWEETTEGTYNITNVAAQTGATTFKQKLLSFGFVGERWISLDCLYDVVDDSNVHVSPYLDGSSYYDLRLQSGEKGKANLLSLHVTGNGFHYLQFYLKPTGASSDGVADNVKGNEKVTLSNFNFSKTKLVTDMSVKYNSDFAELYFDGQLCNVEGSSGIVNHTISVPLAGEFNLEVRPKTDIISSMDESKTTTSQFVTGTVNGVKTSSRDESGEAPVFEANAQNIVKFAITRTSPINFTIRTRQNGNDNGNITLKLNEGETNLELDLTYKELAVAPNVSATKNSEGNNIGNYETIEDGQFIGFPFRKENSLTINIQKFEGFEATDYSIVVNMVEMNGSVQVFDDMLILPIVVNSNSEVIISFTKEDTDLLIYSAYNLTFNVGENPKGEDKDDTEVSNILHVAAEEAGAAQLEICNMAKVFDANNTYGDYKAQPWKFDSALSEEGNYVYTTSLDFEKTAGGYYRPKTAVKILAFELSGADKGSLTFQFKVSGYNNFQDISGAYRGGLLGAYTYSEITSDVVMGYPFSTGNVEKICGSEDGINYTDPTGGILLAKPISNGMEYGGNVIMLADGWCQASIPIAKGPYSGAPSICLAFITCYEGMAAYPLEKLPSASFSIRDVHLITGDKAATLNVCDEAGDATVTAKIGEVEYHAGDSFTATAGSTVELSVDKQGKHFYGWTVNGSLVSTEENAKIFLNGESNIKAWIADEGTYEARAEGVFYSTIKEAVESAEFGQTVYVIKDNAKITEGFVIGEGVTLLLPYSTACRSTETGTPGSTSENRIAWFSDKKAEYRYLTVTVQENVTITIKGTLVVGGILNHPKGQGYQGHTSGAYAELILEKGSSIQVANGGVMDVYGRIWGGEGKQNGEMGTIEVANGGKVYEPFLILDFDGGSNTLGLFNEAHTPFKRYAMINIEVPMTINYGGELLGHASLWVETMKLLAALDQPFVSTKKDSESDTFVMLSEGAKVTITYDPNQVVDGSNIANCTEGIGKIKMVFDGGATFSYMLFSAMGLTVPTNSVYFSIPYNYEIEFNGEYAQYETLTDFMIMPGATVKVGVGATLTLNANAWVLDGLVQGALSSKSYPKAEQLAAANYSRNGNLIVNGTLKIGRKTTVQKFDIFASGDFHPEVIGATFLGVVQTDGSGKIEIPNEDTKLSGKITDGMKGYNYFEYTSTARVWDAAHGCFGYLVAGHTYTATGNAEFRLEELHYATTAGGAQTQTLDLSDQTLHGSWKVEHGDSHVFDWTYRDGDELPNAETPRTTITRQCTELGCDHSEQRDLLFAIDSLGEVDYKGAAYEKEEIRDLVKNLFKDKDQHSIEDGNFTVELPQSGVKNVNADGYSIKITLTNGYWLKTTDGKNAFDSEFSKTFILRVKAHTLVQNEVTAPQDVTFNGAAQKLKPTVRFNGQDLNEGSDYTLAWSDEYCINAGTVTVTVSGTNNFTGEIEVTYQIRKLAIDGASVAGLDGVPFDNTEHKPTPQLTVSNHQVDAGGYTVEYKRGDADTKDFTSAGKITVIFTAKQEGNYSGSVTKTYEISKKDASNATVAVGELTYSGDVLVPEISVTLADFEYDFALDTDYTVQYDKTVQNAGTYTVTVQFTGNFKGSKTQEFQVNKLDVSKEGGTVTVSGTYVYNRASHTPTEDNIKVSCGKFENSVTFDAASITATNNTDAGTASVQVTANGNFTGTVEGTFQIAKAKIDSVKVTSQHTYNGREQTPTLTVTAGELEVLDNEYSVAYSSDRTNAVEVTVTVTSVSKNFEVTEGLGTATFTIAKAKVTVKPEAKTSPEGEVQVELTFTISGTMYNDGADEATLRGGLTCKLDKAFDSSKAGIAFTISVELTDDVRGKLSNYDIDTSATATYTITDAVFKGVDVKDVTAEYDGKEHTVTVTGAPQDAKVSITYTKVGDESFSGDPKAAGTYNVVVEITLGEYKPLTLNPTVTISAKKITVTLHAQTAVYNGKPQSAKDGASFYDLPEGSIVAGDQVTFTISSETATNVSDGSKAIQLSVGGKDKDNYNVQTAAASFSVTPAQLTKDSVKVTSKHTYNGQTQTPTLEVSVGELKLTATDYDVTYDGDRVKAGSVTVNVTGKGNYGGSASATFQIDKAAISSAQATGSYVFDRTQKSATLTVKAGTLTLTDGDYDVAYSGDRTNVGKVTVTITAKAESNYSGSAETSFNITPASVTDATVAEQNVTYDRQAKTFTFTVKAGTLVLTLGEYTVTDNRQGDLTSAGAIIFTVKGTGNFDGERTVNVTIGKANITSVQVTSKHTYNGQAQQPELKVMAGEMQLTPDEYNAPSFNRDLVHSGKVEVTVSGKDNFDGQQTCEFTIECKQVTVTVQNKQSVYGDSLEPLTYTYDGLVNESDLAMDSYVTLSCTATETERPAANTYDIVVALTQPDKDYTIVSNGNGTYTVNARKVTVTVADQSDVWAYGKENYAWNPSGWSVTQGTLAPQEQDTDLAITLSKPSITNAGSYAIAAQCGNSNYDVTFAGSWNGEQNAQTAGTYTVAKAQIVDGENDVHFVLAVGDDEFNPARPEVEFDGTEITLSAYVMVMEGQLRTIEAAVDPTSIKASGIVTVTVTVNDVNYQGSKAFTVVVLDENGYTPNLYKVLQALQTLVGDVTADTLTSSEEHFAIVKGIKAQIETLSEEEKKLGAKELAKYSAIVDAWNNGADIDADVVDTAKTIADAPIRWLFAAGALNALFAAMFVLKRGGIC